MRKIKCFSYFAWQIFRMHLQRSFRVPLSIHISLTNRCNNHCVYCNIHKRPQEDIWTTELLKSTMSEMKNCGTQRVHFTGGEPMLRSDLGELIEYAKNLGFFVSMITNGHQIAERVDELRCVDVVYLSYDGPPKVHSRLRGEYNISEVKSALNALKVSNIPVWTVTVLTRWNADFVEEIVEFARQHNIVATFTMLDFFSDPQGHFHPSFEEIQQLVLRGGKRKKCLQKLIKLRLTGGPVGSSLGYLYNALQWLYDNRTTDSRPSKQYRCWAGRAYADLDADGTLYACSNYFSRASGVSVFRKGFKEAWRKLPLLENCQSCLHASGTEMNLVCSLNSSSILNWPLQLQKIRCSFV